MLRRLAQDSPREGGRAIAEAPHSGELPERHGVKGEAEGGSGEVVADCLDRRPSPSTDTQKLLGVDFPAWQQHDYRVKRVVKFSKPGPVVSHHGVIYHIRAADGTVFFLQVELLTQGIRHNISFKDPLNLVDNVSWSVAREVDLCPGVVREHLVHHTSYRHSYVGWNCQDFAEELLYLAETCCLPSAERKCGLPHVKVGCRNVRRRRYEFYVLDGWPNRLLTRLRSTQRAPCESCACKACKASVQRILA